MKIIMVFGVFDGIHPGHEYLFKRAKELGDWLVVLVARDQTVKKIKGHFPKHKETQRIQALEESPLVDQVVMGSKSNPYTIFNSIKPQVVCLGYDQEVFIDKLPEALKQRNIEAEIIRLEAYQPERYKSSLLNT